MNTHQLQSALDRDHAVTSRAKYLTCRHSSLLPPSLSLPLPPLSTSCSDGNGAWRFASTYRGGHSASITGLGWLPSGDKFVSGNQPAALIHHVCMSRW